MTHLIIGVVAEPDLPDCRNALGRELIPFAVQDDGNMCEVGSELHAVDTAADSVVSRCRALFEPGRKYSR